MDLWAALATVGVLVAATAALGAVWRRRDGRRRRGDGSVVDPADLPGRLAPRATFVQFSTEVCARCPQVRRMLSDLAIRHEGVGHIEVDLTRRTETAGRYRILQTPTTLLVDAGCRIRSRFNGVPRPADLEAALAALPASAPRTASATRTAPQEIR
ncbi:MULTISPECIES: thioredoxin family protein [Microbacterium]|uniref:thioredoxin family protein n=1 Tax=Microbacterium TaxID=33882 RepID=UPI00217DBC38|nr:MULTISPECIES: thioredoxin family protein [Microbacterium]UWF78347.1 thioredoxin family protein [Microbacterium neungamense]WCM56524.1 thioredoxin family protein [Microbacterium sp. EF45047]